jgi:hypothetical protein
MTTLLFNMNAGEGSSAAVRSQPRHRRHPDRIGDAGRRARLGAFDVAGFDWAGLLAIAKDIWWIASVPAVAAAGIGMFYLRSQFPTKQQHDEQTQTLQKSIAALSDRVAGNERQVARIESDLRQLPGRQEYQALGDRIGRVEKEGRDVDRNRARRREDRDQDRHDARPHPETHAGGEGRNDLACRDLRQGSPAG